MAFTPAALAGLRAALDDVLAGRAGIEDIRGRMRHSFAGPARVLRRAEVPQGEESLGEWPRQWPLNVRDVCRVAPERYTERVREWAAVVVATLGGVRR